MGIKKFAATLAAVVMAFSCMAVTGILVPPRKPAKMIAKSANGKTVRRFCPINWF